MKRKGIKKERKDGLTIIEILVAIAIFSIGIVAILYMFPVGSDVQSKSKKQTVAIFLAQEKMEEVASAFYFDDILSPGTVLEDYGTIPGFEDYKREKKVFFFDPENSTTTDIDLGMKKVDVSVFWGPKDDNVRLSTFISRR